MSSSEELLSEMAVLSRWPALSKTSLRIARQQGRISWVKGKRGSAWYRASAIETYIEKELEKPCLAHALAPSSNSETNGLLTTLGQESSIVSGLSQELAERAAQASVQKIFAKQK